MAIETWSRGPAVWFTPLASGSHFSSLCGIRPLKMRAGWGIGRRNWNRGLAQLVRATVSKTVGREFESLSPCQFLPSARSVSKAQPLSNPSATRRGMAFAQVPGGKSLNRLSNASDLDLFACPL